MKKYTFLMLILFFLAITGCKKEQAEVTKEDYYESEFFKEVQLNALFKDSKTFVDMVPDMALDSILLLYNLQKKEEGFDLKSFVDTHFVMPEIAGGDFVSDTTKTMYEHIHEVWGVLARKEDVPVAHASRIALPHPYVVPGGRFREIYYWDSYFTLEGLLSEGIDSLAQGMVDNFSFLLDSVGFIPNGTRNYYLSRSQPPFYSVMVDALARKDSSALRRYFPYILKEYEYWMNGAQDIKENNEAIKRVVKISDTLLLNRYWDSKTTPRPEAYKEDYHLASKLESEKEKEQLYANLRAGAASGWDFSSRWYKTENDFGSTNTTGLLPVDLNSLMYFMETMIARGYENEGNRNKMKEFKAKAEQRKKAIQTYFWNEETGFFYDYDLEKHTVTDQETLAGAYPLFFEVATKAQAEKAKNKLMEAFLKPGGLITTLKETGQQWDAPNGWAPLQWIAVNGLLNYGYDAEAKEIMKRWLGTNERVYKNTGKMMEKYNVEDITLLSGGGEYALQDGFGWSNGVVLGFKHILDSLDKKTPDTGLNYK